MCRHRSGLNESQKGIYRFALHQSQKVDTDLIWHKNQKGRHRFA